MDLGHLGLNVIHIVSIWGLLCGLWLIFCVDDCSLDFLGSMLVRMMRRYQACPICEAMVGMDLVGHITMEHEMYRFPLHMRPCVVPNLSSLVVRRLSLVESGVSPNLVVLII